MRASAERRGAPNELAARARAFIDARRGLDVRVNEVAAALGVTAQWIERRFREAYGMTLKQAIARARDAEIERLVTTTDIPFAEISDLCGFRSPSHFSALYRRTHNLTPTSARTSSRTI